MSYEERNVLGYIDSTLGMGFKENTMNIASLKQPQPVAQNRVKDVNIMSILDSLSPTKLEDGFLERINYHITVVIF